MASLNIFMPGDMRQFVDRRTREGGFNTPTEYVRSLDHYDMTDIRLSHELDCHCCTVHEKVLLAVPAHLPTQRVVLLSTLRD